MSGCDCSRARGWSDGGGPSYDAILAEPEERCEARSASPNRARLSQASTARWSWTPQSETLVAATVASCSSRSAGAARAVSAAMEQLSRCFARIGRLSMTPGFDDTRSPTVINDRD